MSWQAQGSLPSYERQDHLTAEKYLVEVSPHDRSTSPIPPATPHRRSNESSTAGSEYGDELKGMMITSAPRTKSLDVYHTKSHTNMRIHDAFGKCIYYVENSAFTIRKPDVTLLAGDDKNGEVIGVCRWSNMFSKHFAFGIGDPTTDEKGTVWEEVRTETMIHPEHKWSLNLPCGSRHTFAWLRIHGAEVSTEDSSANSASNKNFKLIDCSDESRAALAVFASNRYKSWKKLGKFVIKVNGRDRGWGDQWETMVLLSALGLVEMSRRRGRSRRSQGGSYGG